MRELKKSTIRHELTQAKATFAVAAFEAEKVISIARTQE
jgi:hypothetical protein